jgi:hypothetical protein
MRTHAAKLIKLQKHLRFKGVKLAKRWLKLALAGATILLSYILLPVLFMELFWRVRAPFGGSGSALIAIFVYLGWIIFSGILFVAGVRATRPKPQYVPPSQRDSLSFNGTRSKEVIKEKGVIVKIRCKYCNAAFDETLDKCPNCGAER